MLARVKGELRAVKLYHRSVGGQKAFDRDIAWLGQNM